ncbi:hypothetical protein IAG41_18405 [Sphingomonas sp. JC676]|uniref:hypothetical protein n=1 Tax=Sphingomonas sp. JC676 TaxID=2768065 RepID=UPI0016585D46|nr:hypothetical protein [Sphingomonas sp. JC676]MBC9034365.1 hypothetical protein [Sphingomonas sp. JC676]
MLAFALLLAVAAQDRASTGPVSDDEPAPESRPARCQTVPDEITVCGNPDQSRFRLAPLAPRYETPARRAQFTLPGGSTASVDATQRGVGGVSVPAAMVTLKIPLGKKKAPTPEEK